MEPLSFLANLLLMVTIGTLVIALVAYMAYKLREKRKPLHFPADIKGETDDQMVFLCPYVPPSLSTTQETDSNALHRV